jgi:hypothetical protein
VLWNFNHKQLGRQSLVVNNSMQRSIAMLAVRLLLRMLHVVIPDNYIGQKEAFLSLFLSGKKRSSLRISFPQIVITIEVRFPAEAQGFFL